MTGQIAPLPALQTRFGMPNLNRELWVKVPGSNPTVKFAHVETDPFAVVLTIEYQWVANVIETTFAVFLAAPLKMGDPPPPAPSRYRFVVEAVGSRRGIGVWVSD